MTKWCKSSSRPDRYIWSFEPDGRRRDSDHPVKPRQMVPTPFLRIQAIQWWYCHKRFSRPSPSFNAKWSCLRIIVQGIDNYSKRWVIFQSLYKFIARLPGLLCLHVTIVQRDNYHRFLCTVISTWDIPVDFPGILRYFIRSCAQLRQASAIAERTPTRTSCKQPN